MGILGAFAEAMEAATAPLRGHRKQASMELQSVRFQKGKHAPNGKPWTPDLQGGGRRTRA